MAHPTSKEDDYHGNNDNNEELVDYREPEWNGIDYLPTKSVEDGDNSDEESEVSIDDQMDDNDPHNKPALPLDESQVVL